MTPPPIDAHIVFAPEYEADIGPHVFPTVKYRGVRDDLKRSDGLEAPLPPTPPEAETIRLVHTPEYLDDLFACRWTPRTSASELPISPQIVSWFVLSCGGTMLAAERALESGWAAHLGGGFHHAFADRAEGFCYLNDVAVAARWLQREKGIERLAVIDVDVHQGNGTAAIFAGDDSVFTFSIHQEDNYPVKQPSDLDVGLLSFDPRRAPEPYVTDEVYLAHLAPAVEETLTRGRPELVFYVAGADPYGQDQLGGFQLTRPGLVQRDELVFGACRKRDIPVAATLAGGYATQVSDTIAIHADMVRAARRTWGAP